MSHTPTLPLTKASWRVLRWEPMLGSGERLTVAVIVDAVDGIKSFPLLRAGVLNCLYGEQGEAALAMVKAATKMALDVAKVSGIENADPGMEGFVLENTRVTMAESGVVAARQAGSLYSSLSGGGITLSESEDTVIEDSAAAKFSKALESDVVHRRADLSPYFSRAATPIAGGHPIRFTFLSEHAAVQTSVFRPAYISYGSSASRLRMWELMTVMEESGRRGALIVKKPDLDSPDVGQRAARSIKSWLEQLFEEGDKRQILVMPVETIEAGAEKLVSFAGQ